MIKEIYIHKGNEFDSVAIMADKIEDSLALMKETGIKNLAINTAWGWKKGKALVFLENNPWVEGISLVENDLDIAVFNGLHHLKILALSADRYKGDLDFGNFPELEMFAGTWNSKKFKNLHKCSLLKNLKIWKYPWDDLRELVNLKKLERLELNYGKTTSLKGIQSFKHLHTLAVYSHPGLASLEGVEELDKNLRNLALQNCKEIKDYGPIEDLRNLEALNLSGSAPIKSVKFIRNMKNLVRCYIGTEILDMDPEPLKERGFEFKRSKNYK